MEKEYLTIGYTVGFMLKVMKRGIKIDKYRKEFACIRHGNYFEFINFIKGEVPFTVVYSHGVIETNPPPKKDDCDFVALFKAGPSLMDFYKKCRKEYFVEKDDDVCDVLYYKAVLFEISLRMHANNNHLIAEREDLIDVIDNLCYYKEINDEERNLFHRGRDFINMIKHPKNQFSSWKEGCDAFEVAYSLLAKHKLTIV